MPLSAKIFAAAKHHFGTRVPFRSTVSPHFIAAKWAAKTTLDIILFFYKNRSFKLPKGFRKEEHQSNRPFALSPEPEVVRATGHHLWPFSSIRYGTNQRSKVSISVRSQESRVRSACSRLHIRASAISSRPTFDWTRAVESSGEALSDQVRWPSPAKESQGSRLRANWLNEALSRALSRAVSGTVFRTSGGTSAAHRKEFGLPGLTISLWAVFWHSHLQASARARRLIPSTAQISHGAFADPQGFFLSPSSNGLLSVHDY